MKIVESSASYTVERRKHARLPLSCTAYLMRSGAAELIETRTKNISVDGFYCFVSENLFVGEYIRCIVVVPAFNTEHPESMLSLHCSAKVVRVDWMGARSGIACHIEEYRVGPVVPDGNFRMPRFDT